MGAMTGGGAVGAPADEPAGEPGTLGRFGDFGAAPAGACEDVALVGEMVVDDGFDAGAEGGAASYFGGGGAVVPVDAVGFDVDDDGGFAVGADGPPDADGAA